jgi:hypothetical protein
LAKFNEMEFTMKPLLKMSWLFMTFILLTLNACGGSPAAAPTADTGPVFTQIASTAQALQATNQALQTQLAQAEATISSAPQATPTLAATSTPQITDTLLPTSTPSPKPTIPVVPAATSVGGTSSGGPTPSMDVTLLANGLSGFEATISVGTSLIFKAQVKNTSAIPLQVVANLAVPDGWDVDQNTFSDCPTTESLDKNDSCIISWYFTPHGSGQVYLRVYARGIYTDSAGNSSRITDSPAYLINVVP